MSRPDANLHRLDGPDPVHLAVTMARTFAEAHGLPADSAARLAILVEEMVMNLFDHGGLADGDSIDLGLTREQSAVHMLLIDRALPFDPRHAAPDTAIPDRGGNAGLALLRAWAEIVDYRSAAGANRLELRIPDTPLTSPAPFD